MLKKQMFMVFMICLLLMAAAAPQVMANRALKSTVLTHDSSGTGAYRALIIGIDDYKDPKIPDLETPLNDAKKIDEILKDRYGFKTELLLGKKATKRGIYKALRSLAASAKPDESVLIYYAGHGELDRQFDDGWWIPYDAKGGDSVTYLDNTVVQKTMRSTKAKHVLLVSDSCYSGSLFGSSRAMPPVLSEKYYLNMYSEKSRWGMTSGNKEPVSDSGTGGHSVFAYQLIKALKKNEKQCFTTQELYTRIAPIIGNNSEQTPMCRPVRRTGDQGGQFVFLLASSGAYSDAPLKKGGGKPAPVSFISVSSNIKESDVFIDGKPQGKTDIANLKVPPGEHTIRVEKEGYIPYSRKVVARKNRKISFQAFLDEMPDPKAALYVDTIPKDARISIRNVSVPFSQGMELEKGKYQVEVTADGYKYFETWTELAPGEDKSLLVRLEELPGAGARQIIKNSVGMAFAYIDPDTFMMGSPYGEPGRGSGETRHRVTLTEGYYMQTTEVTKRQWQEVMGTSPWQGREHVKENPNSPAVYVSWDDCQEFVRRLNDMEGAERYRLPTEAQWEYAARAGRSQAYSFGDNAGSLGDYAWYGSNAYDAGELYAHPVGLKRPNAFGLFDMHGNVWEWCRDKAEWRGRVVTDTYYAGAVDPVCEEGSARVRRGGGWSDKASDCRSAFRRSRKPDRRVSYIGFRLVRVP